ncbi:hypothetical protein FM996_21770 [Methylosinus sporium]|uniref:Uncharacterized protein n=1 Tax=Methylosinus sporium TaxID=428 RepID=A0A549SCD7_METSR|nr:MULTISPECIES: hypothetical protein [Methylosinus]MBU3887382.1 hypothetical protein [Methylosinus sp. KRF6]TRL20662.1 hypothetical protein FM996_21770 [Methylosinus sporium]
MTKFCLIGDSHLGALGAGIAAIDISAPDYETTFFSMHARNFPALQMKGRELEGATDELRREFAAFSGGRESIELDLYDAFVIVGQGLSIGHLVDLYRDYCCDSMPGPQRGRYLLSDACYISASERIIGSVNAMKIGRLIRSVTDKPITFVAAPNPGSGVPESEMPPEFPPFYTAVECGDAESIAMIFRAVCARIAKAKDVRIIPPIDEAAENGLFNRQEFSLLAERDAEGAPLSDRIGAMVHGNGRYGAMLARVVFDREAPL